MSISLNIRKHRKRLNLSQKELGVKLCKTEAAVRMWELGKNEPPLSTSIQLADIFDLSLDELVGRNRLRGKVN